MKIAAAIFCFVPWLLLLFVTWYRANVGVPLPRFQGELKDT